MSADGQSGGTRRPAATATVAAPGVAIGSHVLADLYGVARALLCDGAALQRVLHAAAQEAGAHVLASHFHSFGANDGVTGVVLLAESHLSIHTWPEYGFAAADIFMCGASQPGRALDVLVRALAPMRQEVRTQGRGSGTRGAAAPETTSAAER